MGQGGFLLFPAVSAPAYYFISPDNDAAHRHFSVIKGFLCQPQRFFHKQLIHSFQLLWVYDTLPEGKWEAKLLYHILSSDSAERRPWDMGNFFPYNGKKRKVAIPCSIPFSMPTRRRQSLPASAPDAAASVIGPV
jgi:hypothetical protein